MRTRTKALIGGLALLVMAASATLVLRSQERDAVLAELEVARQSVKVERATGEVSGADQPAELAVGDRVTTDERGLGTVNWFDGSLTRLGGGADFVVEELASAAGGRQIVGELRLGESWHRVQQATGSGSRFEVRTQDAIASVRGTTFLVRCVPNCRYGVASGRVQVATDEGESVTLEGGEQVGVDENGKLGEVEPLDLDDPWVRMNQDLDAELPPLEGGKPGPDNAPVDDAPGEDPDADGSSITTRQAFAPPPTTSPPTTAAPVRPRSTSDGTNDREEAPAPPATTSTGTIPTDPTPPPPPPPPPPVAGSPEPSAPAPGPSVTSVPVTPKTSEAAPTTSSSTSSSSTTSSSTTSSSTTSSSTTSSSTTSSSTTSSSTTSSSTTSTSTPPTTAVPTTSPPEPPVFGGGGGGPPAPTTTPPTTAPSSSTTSTTEPPEEKGSISGTVFEPEPEPEPEPDTTDTTDTTVGLTSLETGGATAVACPPAVEGEVVVCFAEVIAADGTYKIPNLPSGLYEVFAVPPEARTDLQVSQSALVELAVGQHKAGVDLIYELTPTVGSIEGTVTKTDGIAVPGATVWACGPDTDEFGATAILAEEVVVDEPNPCLETVTAEDGTYRFEDLIFGTWTLYADHELFFSAGVSVSLEPTAAEAAQDLVLAFETEPIFCARECVIAGAAGADSRLSLPPGREPPAPP